MGFLRQTPTDGCLNGSTLRRYIGVFALWVNQVVEATGAQVVPIDGKSVKGSYERNRKQSALHLVSAWASEYRVLLGQVKVADKSNEITAIPALLELLDITGCIITIDAIWVPKPRLPERL